MFAPAAARETLGMAAITLVGAGRIGLQVAERLVAAGHWVDVVDVREDLQGVVEGVGARWGGSSLAPLPADRVMITVLPGSPELRELMLGPPDGSAPAALALVARGGTWIDLTSTAPDLAADLATAATARGVCYVEAAVGGGPTEARRGGLTLYVGGELSEVQRLRPVFEAFADPARIHHMGGHGAGYLTKLLINQLWFGQAVAVAEVLLLGAHAGLATDQLAEVLDSSPAASAFVHIHLKSLLAGDYLPAFGLARVVEELDSLARTADSAGTPWSLSKGVLEYHRQALAHFGDVDGELLGAAWLEHLAGQTLAGATRRDLPSDGSGEQKSDGGAMPAVGAAGRPTPSPSSDARPDSPLLG
jgi:3-hydroxyisobutyrate dehydrogenase-like beta-hydroxyacid dehydrogenase